ncbi:MAG: SprB repeat-containing protein [Flammeovirgaceae bacterium]
MRLSYLSQIIFKVIVLLFLFGGCTNNDINKKFDCTNSDLEISSSKINTSGCKATDGSIVVSATKGSPPYSFRINGGTFQTSSTFPSLLAGSYTLDVKDANECVKSIAVTIDAANSSLEVSRVVVNNSGCTTPNGIITVNGSGGAPPYLYSIGTEAFASTNLFQNLKEGTYTVTVKDAIDCQKALGVVVGKDNTGIKYSTNIKPILDKSCNLSGCHVAGGRFPDLTNFTTLSSQRASVKSRTANRSMPPSGIPDLTTQEIALIGCWVDDGALNN